MEAIQLLKNEHAVMRLLFAELAATTFRAFRRRGKLLDRIARTILIHAQIEEEIFYPAFKAACGACESDRMFFESVEEHRTAVELLLPDLLATSTASTNFGSRARILRELVEHHADEEEAGMLPRARELMSHRELAELGDALETRASALAALELSQLMECKRRAAAAERATRRAALSMRKPACAAQACDPHPKWLTRRTRFATPLPSP